ncbi:MAG TPA: YraN family protein [Bacteroidota bacterium]|nr:YraN family protein [Bacteroidota bacterium]
MTVNKREQGNKGEEIAARYLEGQGFKIFARNYRFERGEIDIVAEDGGELVFVEVKMRSSLAFGYPEESVTPQKEEQIRNVAEGYLLEHGIEEKPCRFDIVAIQLKGEEPEINHIRDAF